MSLMVKLRLSQKSKMKHLSNILFVLALAVFLPHVASADTIYRSGESVSMTADQRVDGDFYVTAGTASLSGEVTEDVLVAAGSATLNGVIGADALVVGETVQMHASVTDDVRIIGREVKIAEHIGGDLVVIAQSLEILSTAQIDGDLMFFGGEAEVMGPVGDSIYGISNRVRIDASVGGVIDVETNQLLLGDKASIAGDITYLSPVELQRTPSTVIEGAVSRNAVLSDVTTKDVVQSLLIPLFILLFAALTVFLLAKPHVVTVATLTHTRFWFKVAVGGSLFFGLPVLAALLFATMIGVLLGAITLFVWILLLFMAIIFLPSVVGQWIMRFIKQRFDVTIFTITLGALAIEFALFLPVVGLFVVLVFLFVVMGTMATMLYRSLVT